MRVNRELVDPVKYAILPRPACHHPAMLESYSWSFYRDNTVRIKKVKYPLAHLVWGYFWGYFWGYPRNPENTTQAFMPLTGSC